MESVQQRVALVTGANRGLGLEIAKQLAQRDMNVVLTARDKTRGLEATKMLTDLGLSVSFCQLDVTSDDSVQAAVEHVRSKFGRLDVLINNAGIALGKWTPAMKIDIKTFIQTFETNLFGVMRVTLAFVPLMREHGYGRIVNLSSSLGSLEKMTGYAVAYRASKTSINAITRVLAAELKYDGVLVNSMCPGWVRTELGGDDAPRSPEVGADTAVWLATLPQGGPTGGFFQDRKQLPW